MVSRILYITSTGKSGKCVNRHGFPYFFFFVLHEDRCSEGCLVFQVLQSMTECQRLPLL